MALSSSSLRFYPLGVRFPHICALCSRSVLYWDYDSRHRHVYGIAVSAWIVLNKDLYEDLLKI
jgi:hypothetical protein